MQVDIRCAKCGSKNLVVRTSDRMTMHSTSSIVYCNSCHACKMQVMSEIVQVEIASYEQSDAVMRLNKPLDETDPNQIEMPMN
ncbi:hypothetical protein A4G18_07350 [Pasteurellaceae bacterium Pebbles2]|nr:hypothetical protein [Pasteurellaceae bacterium Pebbles2]